MGSSIKLQLILPESSLISLAGLKIKRESDEKNIKEGKITGPDTTHPLLADKYELTLSFKNPGHNPPTDVSIASFEIMGGETTSLLLGAIVFNIAEGLLVDKNVHGVSVIERDTGKTLLTIDMKPMGNSYYFFKPKPVPAGEYDIEVHYVYSTQPTVIATNIVVEDGKESFVTLDSGIVIEKPNGTAVNGWDLIPSGKSEPLLVVRRGSMGREYPLWSLFIVPPGTYDIYIHVSGMDEPLPVGEGIEIQKGQTLKFNTGM